MEEIRNEEIKNLADASAEELAEAIAEVLDNKKANDVKVVKVGDKTVIAEYFVIAGGNTNTHVRSLADEVEYKIGLAGVDPIRVEGKADSWKVLDYAHVIVHIFDREAREFYKLDRLYTDFE
jgi:ribosome-associated protein